MSHILPPRLRLVDIFPVFESVRLVLPRRVADSLRSLFHRNYLSKEWFLQRSTWGKSDLATQIGEILGPRDGEKVEKALPSPPDSDAEKAV